jgi:acyl dehydratase
MSPSIVGKSTKKFRHVAEARWLMSYAAGLGDYRDEYMDTGAGTGIVGHPVFPVCVEWPVILDVRNVEGSEAMTAEEGARGVHASHDLHIHRSVRADEVLFTRATIIGVEARKPGAYQTMRIDTVDEAGESVATTYQGGMSRQVAVSGPDRIDVELPPIPTLEVGGYETQIEIPVAAQAAHVYTECARIFNPIHTDRAVALSAGLPDIILHGTATLALAVSRIVDLYTDHPQQVSRVACRFSGMVLMPSTLTLHVQARSEQGIWFEVRTAQQTPAVSGGFVGLR